MAAALEVLDQQLSSGRNIRVMHVVPDIPVREENERDGRRLSRMSDETKVVHARLEAWGRWAKADGLRAWPQTSLMGRIAEQGLDGAAIHSIESKMPDHIAEVDAAVAALGEVDRRVIRTYYLENAPVKEMARCRRMSVSEFKNVLTRARWRVEGYLKACTK